MNFTHITLGELLSSTNEIIKRNATSILKQFQKETDPIIINETIYCPHCDEPNALKQKWKKENNCTIIIKEKCTKCDYKFNRK